MAIEFVLHSAGRVEMRGEALEETDGGALLRVWRTSSRWWRRAGTEGVGAPRWAGSWRLWFTCRSLRAWGGHYVHTHVDWLASAPSVALVSALSHCQNARGGVAETSYGSEKGAAAASGLWSSPSYLSGDRTIATRVAGTRIRGIWTL